MKDLHDYLLALADDELILGHRDSEWCGHAPILEEDIAFANLALDEIGHANLWYGLLAEIEGLDSLAYPDQLIFFREPEDYRNIQMVELPNGDWAFTILRQYLFDTVELVRLEAMTQSRHAPLAGIAAKILKEERYHHRHTSAWVRRLALGTTESQHRMQKALNELWPYTREIFYPVENENALVSTGIVPDPTVQQRTWTKKTTPFLQESSLTIPGESSQALRRTEHTPHLKVLLSEMQSVARSESGARW